MRARPKGAGVRGALLSVIIPTWNRAHVVCEAVESALGQRDAGVEVVVVDDGSTDNTAALLARRFGSRIKLLRRRRRGGTASARNLGVRAATGEFIAFLDSDDLWLPGKLDAELAVFERLPEAEAVVSDNLIFREWRSNVDSRFASNGLLAATGGRVRYLDDCPWLWGHWRNNLAICSLTLRRDALARLGEPVFRDDITEGEDWELEMRVYNACRVAVLPKAWTHMRRFRDDTRPGRGCQITALRDKLTVLGRTLKLDGLRADVAEEIESCRRATALDLARRLIGNH